MNPKILEIQLTPSCNFNCVYCGNSPDLINGENLKKEYALKAIYELKPETILFTGGEVYHAWNTLIEILNELKSKDFNYILSSNLSLISTNELRLLIDEYGFETFHSSFNDLTETMTKDIRGVHSHLRSRIIENMKYLTSRDVILKVETMLIPHNIEHLSEINEFLYALGVKYHKLEYLIPVGHAGDGLILSPEYITDKVYEFYVNKKNDTIIELTCFCISPCMEFTKKLFDIHQEDLIFNKCIDGRESCYLLSDGTLVPCFLFPEKESDINVKTNDLLYEWENNRIFKGFRQDNGECVECNHFYYNDIDAVKVCNNGCATYNYIKNRNFTGKTTG